MSDENPYLAPQSDTAVPVQVGAAPGPHNYASLAERFVGAFIDGVIFLIVAVVLMFAATFLTTSGSPGDVEFWDEFAEETNLLVETVSLVLSLFIYIGIQWAFWNATSQSIGKKVMKTQIVNLDGTPTDVKTIAFKRYALIGLAGLIPGNVGQWVGLIDAVMIFRADRNCLHDDIAKTRVIKLPASTQS